MSLLGGGLKSVFNTAFGSIFLPGTVHVPSRTFAQNGDVTETFVDQACKAIAIEYSDRQRAEGGYSERDVQIIILQGSTAAEAMNTDFEVTARKPGKASESIRYSVASVSEDPAGATWTLRGTALRVVAEEEATFDSTEVTFDSTEHTFDEAA